MLKKEVRAATITGNRVSRGARGDAFQLQIIDENGRGVFVNLTPEQWALALWGRGDVEIEAEWIGLEPSKEQQ